MMLKEYRILLPLSVEEYRIAQLYMIAKKSRQDTSGAGSGVEIICNEPYENGPGGLGGQYTHKIYHIGNHLPSWFRSILPKSALAVEEEAWNAYPYTKTRYTCPFVPKLLLEVETRYYNDSGTRENVFDLDATDIGHRVIDYMDIVKDPISAMEYVKEEDPKLYISEKTNRGPLTEDWVEDCVRTGKSIMCAYKLCRVEFQYWGLQTKIEKFIHDVALRKTMVRAHRQAWAWQDEWHGLTIADIRVMERQTQEMLNELMRNSLLEFGESPGVVPSLSVTGPETNENRKPSEANAAGASMVSLEAEPTCSNTTNQSAINGRHSRPVSPTSSLRSAHGTVSATSLRDRWEAIRSDSDGDSVSVYFDALDADDSPTLPLKQPSIVRWSSVEMMNDLDGTITPSASPKHEHSDCRLGLLLLVFHGGSPLDALGPHAANHKSYFTTDSYGTKLLDVQTLRATINLVVKANYPDLMGRIAVQLVPCAPFTPAALGTLASLSPYGGDINQALSDGVCHPALVTVAATQTYAYEEAVYAAISKANHVYNDFLASDDGHGFNGEVWILGDAMGGLIAHDVLSRQRKQTVSRHPSSVSAHSDVSTVIREEQVLEDYVPLPCTSGLMLNNTNDENEHPSLVTDRIRSQSIVSNSDEESECSMSSVRFALRPAQLTETNSHSPRMSASPLRQHFSFRDKLAPGNTNGSVAICKRLQFKVTNLFLCGTPIGQLLVHRKLSEFMQAAEENAEMPVERPLCEQVYNLYYPIDPCAARLEPLLCKHWQRIAPLNVPRYVRFPHGDGQSLSLLQFAKRYRDELLAAISCDPHVNSGSHSVLSQALSGWWGTRRVDYAVYCPEGLGQFPQSALPNILHSSYWESTDVVSFIIRQFVVDEPAPDTIAQVVAYNASESMTSGQLASRLLRNPASTDSNGSDSQSLFTPAAPIEKWSRRRTSFKIKNAQSNHRANDVIVNETQPQLLSARFMYGPLDVVALSGERVDVYVRQESVCATNTQTLVKTDSLDEKKDTATPTEKTKDIVNKHQASKESKDTVTASNSTNGNVSNQWVVIGQDVTDSSGRLNFEMPNEYRLGAGVHSVKMVVRGDHTYLDMYCAVVPPDTQAVVFSIDGSFTASVSVTGKDPKVRPGAVDVVRLWQDLGYLILYITARPDMQQRQVVSWLAQHNFPHGLLFFTGGFSTDPLRHKTMYLQKLVTECGVSLKSAYGSSKDIHVYASAGLPSDRIFVVGKCSKKLQPLGRCLQDGYAAHLNELTNGHLQGIAQSAQGNGRMILRKAYFHAPGQYYRAAAASVQRSHSFTPRSGKYSTLNINSNQSATYSNPNNPLERQSSGSMLQQQQQVSPALSQSSRSVRGLSPFRNWTKR